MNPELEKHMEEVYAVPNFDLTNKVVVYKVVCPCCGWKLVSWSSDVSLTCLIEHMRIEHKEDLLVMIKDVDNFEQVLIDMLLEPPVKFGRQLLRKQLSTWAVPLDVWTRMPDVVNM